MSKPVRAIAVVLLASLAACGSRAEQVSTETAQVRSSGTKASTTTSAAASPALPRPCDLVTLNQVVQAVGRPLRPDPNNGVVVEGDPETTAAHRRNCVYLSDQPDDHTLVTIAVHSISDEAPSPDDEARVISTQAPGSEVVDVPGAGAGSAAVTGTPVGVAIAVEGDLRLTASVSDGVSDNLEAESALIAAMRDALG